MSSIALSPQALAALPLAAIPHTARQGQPRAVVILDLRRPHRRRRGRIPGSHPIAPGLLLSGDPPEGDLILVGETGAAAAAVAEALHETGYGRLLRHLDGGFPAWEAAGLPIERPEAVAEPLLRVLRGVTRALGAWPAATSRGQLRARA